MWRGFKFIMNDISIIVQKATTERKLYLVHWKCHGFYNHVNELGALEKKIYRSKQDLDIVNGFDLDDAKIFLHDLLRDRGLYMDFDDLEILKYKCYSVSNLINKIQDEYGKIFNTRKGF